MRKIFFNGYTHPDTFKKFDKKIKLEAKKYGSLYLKFSRTGVIERMQEHYIKEGEPFLNQPPKEYLDYLLSIYELELKEMKRNFKKYSGAGYSEQDYEVANAVISAKIETVKEILENSTLIK